MKLKVRLNFVVLTEDPGEMTRPAKVGKNYQLISSSGSSLAPTILSASHALTTRTPPRSIHATCITREDGPFDHFRKSSLTRFTLGVTGFQLAPTRPRLPSSVPGTWAWSPGGHPRRAWAAFPGNAGPKGKERRGGKGKGREGK